MKTYTINELGGKNNLAKKVASLIEKEEVIKIKGLGLVDSSNVKIVCSTINMMLKLDKTYSNKREYKRRTEEENLIIAEYTKTHSIGETSRLFDIPVSTVNYIRKKYGIKHMKKSSANN